MKKNMFLIVLILLTFTMTGCFGEKKEYGAKDWVGTKWKDTDGYELEVFESSCQITKDGEVMANKCNFVIDSNDSGVGKIEICDRFGLECDDREISTTNYGSVPSSFNLHGTTWYLQNNK